MEGHNATMSQLSAATSLLSVSYSSVSQTAEKFILPGCQDWEPHQKEADPIGKALIPLA